MWKGLQIVGYKKILDLEDNYIKLYKFTCSLPKEQSYMLCYLIDAEAFVNNRLSSDPDFFEVNKTTFIHNLLSGWSVKEIDTALKGLKEAGYIYVQTVQLGMIRSTYVKLNIEALNRLNAEHKKGALRSIQKAHCGAYKSDVTEHTKGGIINNNNNNNINNNKLIEETKYEKDKRIKNEQKEILDYFNGVCATNYNVKSDGRQLKALLELGIYSIDEIKQVIDFKFKEWGEIPYRFSDGTWSSKNLTPYIIFKKENFNKYWEASHNKSDLKVQSKSESSPILEERSEFTF